MKSNIDSGAGVRSPQQPNISANRSISNDQRGSGSLSSNDTKAPLHHTSPKKRAIMIVAYILIVLVGLGIGSGSYLYTGVLNQIGQTKISVIKSADAEENIPIDLDDLDAEQITNGDTSSSWEEGGHTKVYVNSDFPIEKVTQKDKNVENILIFGVDSRGSSDVQCRADALMIVSLDSTNKSIKLISLMRDTSVTIEGRSENDKLTHSYAYGGVGLLVNTINQNYGLDIQRFVMFDFSSAAYLIDLIDGIYIEVQANEVKYANQEIKDADDYLTQAGYQKLNGAQAIAWARIRHADSDFVRTSRQRAVASALVQKMAGQNELVQLSILEDALGMFETNMTQTDLIRVGTVGVDFSGSIIEYRIPDDGLFSIQQDPWMMVIDWENQLPKLHEYIWGRSDI